MNIAIIANDKKKELITEFCIAYAGILSRHSIYATATTAKYISEATGLNIQKMLSGFHGGLEQITSMVTYDDVDLLIMLRDPSSDVEYRATEVSLIQACDRSNIPCATNIATAEALVLALGRGDLDWRDIIKGRK